MIGVVVVTVGATTATAVTLTVAVAVFELPPALAQTREYVYVLTVVKTPVEEEPPDVVFAPDQSPEAVHEEGVFVVVQVKVGLTVFTIPEVGLAERVTTGTGTNVVNVTSAPYEVPTLLVAYART